MEGGHPGCEKIYMHHRSSELTLEFELRIRISHAFSTEIKASCLQIRLAGSLSSTRVSAPGIE